MRACPTIGDRQAISFPWEQAIANISVMDFFGSLILRHKRKISHSCVEFLELRLDMFGSSTLEKLVNKILQLTLGSFLDDVSSPAMSWVWPGCWLVANEG